MNSDLCVLYICTVYIYIFRLRSTVIALGAHSHTCGENIALAWDKLLLDIDGLFIVDLEVQRSC